MNKTGVTQLLTIMLAVTFIVLGLALAGSTKSFVDASRNTTGEFGNGLDCDNDTISNFNKGACVTTDLLTPAFVGIAIGLAGLIVGAKVVFSR